jgi:hypothetical protein
MSRLLRIPACLRLVLVGCIVAPAHAHQFKILAWNVESNRPGAPQVSDPGVISEQLVGLFENPTSRAQIVASIKSTTSIARLVYEFDMNPDNDVSNPTIRFSFAAVPEPCTYAMTLAGLVYTGYSMFRRRKRA